MIPFPPQLIWWRCSEWLCWVNCANSNRKVPSETLFIMIFHPLDSSSDFPNSIPLARENVKGYEIYLLYCIAKAHIAEKSNCSTLCVWWNVFKCTCRCSFAYLLETTLDDMIWYDIGEGENTWLWLVHSHTQHCRHFFWFPYFQSFHPRQVYRRFACAQHAMFYDIEKWKKI